MKKYFAKIVGAVGVIAALSLLGFANSASAQINLNLNFSNQTDANSPNLQVNLNLLNLIAQAKCFSDKQIQQAVRSNKILPLSAVIKRAGISKNSKVLPPIKVCRVNGELFYQFSILKKDGRARKIVLPASASLP